MHVDIDRVYSLIRYLCKILLIHVLCASDRNFMLMIPSIVFYMYSSCSHLNGFLLQVGDEGGRLFEDVQRLDGGAGQPGGERSRETISAMIETIRIHECGK